MRAANFWKVSFALSLYFATSSFADDLSSRVSSLESRMSAIKIETAKKTFGAQMASASPLFDGYGLFVSADLLFWHLYEGGTDFSLSRHVSGSQNFPTISGKSSRVHFDWDWGFRIGGGYHFEHDAWDAYVNFTWFQTDASTRAHPPSGGTLVPQKGAVNTVTADNIKAHWDVHNYVLDLELGRRFFVSKFLAFRPQFGIETAWIFQHRRFKMAQPLDPTTGIEGGTVRGRCNFWGIGPRAGVEGTWFFGKHFSLFGSANGALLWGHFDTRNKENIETPTGDLPSLRVDDDFHRLVPNVQMVTGLSWDANIDSDLYHLEVKLGYEFQYWWRQNQFLNEQQPLLFGLQHESKDMTLNGVTLDVRFDF
jgi:hypothetical protein